MRNKIVTRFSVPLEDESVSKHQDVRWLQRRLHLFHKYYVPCVEPLDIPVILLCSSESVEIVRSETQSLNWVQVEKQDEWYGGWEDAQNVVLTRLDSDDLVHPEWFVQLNHYSEDAQAYYTDKTYMLYEATGQVYEVDRPFPAALIAMDNGGNPYTVDHRMIPNYYSAVNLSGRYLLQIVHEGNVINNVPEQAVEVDPSVLSEFGLQES